MEALSAQVWNNHLLLLLLGRWECSEFLHPVTFMSFDISKIAKKPSGQNGLALQTF